MKVYLHTKSTSHTMHICPAGDTGFIKGEAPHEWVDENNVPKMFEVTFKHGKAEVDDKIGKYLIERGLAKKTKLILPDED